MLNLATPTSTSERSCYEDPPGHKFLQESERQCVKRQMKGRVAEERDASEVKSTGYSYRSPGVGS